MFNEINISDLKINPFTMIGKQWMLITAGNESGFNTMTASWGGIGVLWGRNVVTCYVRPQRYTYEFMEKGDYFTLSFYSEEYRNALNICGSKSGRDIDKVAVTGLTPVYGEHGVYFEEAETVLICKKIYFQDFDPKHFLDETIEGNYPKKDYHRMYIGEIEKVLTK